MTSDTRHTNRLINETSPYLLQHAHNPVDWYPWGEEAFARARAEDKPIFLSIGYAACHWCHVMAHESFENEAIAALMNEHFINIKVDREERPDIDEIYMMVTQMLTGHGGWPMSVWLTPDLEPFYAGTYFPPRDRMGMPGFPSLLEGIANVWKTEREQIAAATSNVMEHINSELAPTTPSAEVTREVIDAAITSLGQRFDKREGGFGGAPKFPPSMAIALLLAEHHRTGDEHLLHMAELTLQKMARGGMYDQLGGGFHRYSVDDIWLVPHFEKMLYDNALLAPVYFDAALVTGNDFYARIGREILNYTLREMTHPAGGFYSAQDADSEGVEGKYYTFGPGEVAEVLGAEDAALFCEFFDITEGGNWHEAFQNTSILRVQVPLVAFAESKGIEPAELFHRLESMKSRLMAVRDQRIAPLKDDKILTAWNGLMIAAMARGAQVTGDDHYLNAANHAVEFIFANLYRDGRLLRSYREGKAIVPAVLEDYAYLIHGLLELYQTTFDPQLLERARTLARRMISDFYDPEHGGFYTTDGRDASILVRMKDFYDGATPSGNSVAVSGLLRLALIFNEESWRDAAEKTIRTTGERMRQIPPAHHNMIQSVAWMTAPPREVAVVGDLDSEAARELLRELWQTYIPHRIMVAGPGDEPLTGIGINALLAGKSVIDGQPTVYVCQNYACQKPVHTARQAIELMAN